MEEEEQQKSVVSKLKHFKGVEKPRNKEAIQKFQGAVNKVQAMNRLRDSTKTSHVDQE